MVFFDEYYNASNSDPTRFVCYGLLLFLVSGYLNFNWARYDEKFIESWEWSFVFKSLNCACIDFGVVLLRDSVWSLTRCWWQRETNANIQGTHKTLAKRLDSSAVRTQRRVYIMISYYIETCVKELRSNGMIPAANLYHKGTAESTKILNLFISF